MKHVLKKTFTLIITLLIVSMAAFFVFSVIPGDPTTKLLGTEYTEERAQALRESMGLDKPVPIRYLLWLKDFVTGDWGTSYSYHLPVRQMLGEKLPVTLTLSVMAFFMIVIFSIPMGILLAMRKDSVLDRLYLVINQLMMAIPAFFIGILVTLILGLILKIFTPGAYVSYEEDLGGFLYYLIFPALAIAIPKAAMSVKMLRANLIAQQNEDYVRTARSRGNTDWGIMVGHVLRHAMVPQITFLAMNFANIVAGSIVVEQVFTVPGIGQLLLASIMNRDYPVVQAIIVFIALVVIIMNYLSDILYPVIDPRIRGNE